METILTKIMEKFADTFQQALNQLVSVLNDGMYSKIALIASRLDIIEMKMAQFQSKTPDLTTMSTNPTTSTEVATRALIAVEQEREEIRLRARNVVISGLPPSNSCTDIELLESVCEQHLTVKPHILRARRLGKDKTSTKPKLCATLESRAAVDDLIEWSIMLRRSSNASVRRIYFNRDLTPRQQADTAYKNRCESRLKLNQSSVHSNSDSNLNPEAASFQAMSS
jgi:hypothetical protein